MKRLILWSVLLLLSVCVGWGGSRQSKVPTVTTVQAKSLPGFGAQWQLVPGKTSRVMMWGGTETPGIPSSTALPLSSSMLTNYAGFPTGTICWDTFQVGSKGRGSSASYLIVQPPVGVGIAIRDDAPFQRPRLCTEGVPNVTLINNWDENQIMTFFIEGEIVQ